MEIGINENDDIDDFELENDSQEQNTNQKSEQDSDLNENQENNQNNEEELDFTSALLKSRGIDDKSKIKFENEEGEIEEIDWDNLSNKDKLNIIESSKDSPETGLDNTEIELINAIRNSGMTPSEYLNYIGQGEVQRYIQNNTQPQFEIDQYSDDELFLMDFLSRTGEVTNEEAAEALERAKTNESLFKKQVEAIRNEYRQAEQENLMQVQLEQEQINQQEYDQFSNQIIDEINNLTDIQGFDLNMNNDDMQMLYDFIMGQDAAGNNYLAKALSDPQTLVKTAWFALNGDQMINDITSYFQKEISNVRKQSYKKGVSDTQDKINKNNVVFKEKSNRNHDGYDDLDDF